MRWIQEFINPGTLYLARPDGRGKYIIFEITESWYQQRLTTNDLKKNKSIHNEEHKKAYYLIYID
jgi:hypothetical protein